MDRRLLLGNSEVDFYFCPEEILYISTIPNTEKCELFLVNGQKYEVPNTRKNICKRIDDEFHKDYYNGVICSLVPVGKAFIINLAYLDEGIGTDHVCLKANLEGDIHSQLDVQLPREVCEHLAMAKGMDKRAQRRYQQNHYPAGYRIIQKGSGYGTGFIMREFVVIDRDESYYDINEKEMMFLGV